MSLESPRIDCSDPLLEKTLDASRCAKTREYILALEVCSLCGRVQPCQLRIDEDAWECVNPEGCAVTPMRSYILSLELCSWCGRIAPCQPLAGHNGWECTGCAVTHIKNPTLGTASLATKMSQLCKDLGIGKSQKS